MLTSAALSVMYLANLGRIVFNGTEGILSIRSLQYRFELKLPLATESWWHYIHQGKSRANDVHVVLHVQDDSGRQVYFSETIMFDTRHPDEVPYKDEGIPDGAVVIKIQRADKLQRFLSG